MDFFVRYWKVNRGGMLMMFAFQAGLFLMGVVMVLIINIFNKDRDYAAIGGMMALMATIIGGLTRGTGMSRYQLAVSMGRTRRSYMLADPILTAINCAAGIAFAWLLNQLELRLYAMIYSGWELALNIFHKIDQWWFYLAFILGICLLDFLFGALMLRFGSKGFAAVWFPLCFLPLIITGSVDAAKEGGTSLLAQIGRGMVYLTGLMPPMLWAAVGGALLLALLTLSVLFYRKAEIRM